MHGTTPRWLRCSRLTVFPIRLGLAPCPRGAAPRLTGHELPAPSTSARLGSSRVLHRERAHDLGIRPPEPAAPILVVGRCRRSMASSAESARGHGGWNARSWQASGPSSARFDDSQQGPHRVRQRPSAKRSPSPRNKDRSRVMRSTQPPHGSALRRASTNREVAFEHRGALHRVTMNRTRRPYPLATAADESSEWAGLATRHWLPLDPL